MRKFLLAIAAVACLASAAEAQNYYYFPRRARVYVTYPTVVPTTQMNYIPQMFLQQSISQGVYGVPAYGYPYYSPYGYGRPMFQYGYGF